MKAENNKHENIEPPSSLFSQAREGNTIYFLRDGTLFIFELKSVFIINSRKKVEISFDESIEVAFQEANDFIGVFKYDKDVPDDHCLWHKGVPNIYLSPLTQRISLEGQGVTPLDFEQLYALPSYQPAQIIGEGSDQELCWLVLAACGVPTINIFLDGRRLFVHIDYTNASWLNDMKGYEAAPGATLTDLPDFGESIFAIFLIISGLRLRICVCRH